MSMRNTVNQKAAEGSIIRAAHFKRVEARRREVKRNRLLLSGAALLVCIIMAITVTSVTVNGNVVEKEKCYKSIVIEPGDTLWDIAGRYYDKSCDTLMEYMQELRQINNLSGDDIHSGNYLLVYYYTN